MLGAVKGKTSTRQIRVLLADDHRLVRSGIRALVERLDGVEVVAEAADGREALRLTAQHRPDVVLMDIAMPGLNGLEATGRIKKQFRNVRVLILSMHADHAYVSEALAAGAEGYMLKDAGAVELGLSIRAVARGDAYLSPAVAKHVVSDIRRPAGDGPGDRARMTPRQREILQLVAEGHSTKDIAHKLELSIKTVETHRVRLMERLDIHDVAGLVRYAIRIGMVMPET
jgi:DNA-binding NarL/FixJ family response regulator